MSEQNEKGQMSRRDFIRKGGYVAGGAIGGGILGGYLTQYMTKNPKVDVVEGQVERYTQALMYFSNAEDFKVLSLASERIFPADELGPGAIELDVPYYIDHQLAGTWGNNARDYMMGPFFKGIETQGFQSHLRRNEIFSQGIAKIQSYSQDKYKKKFTELADNEQDEVLTAFEAGKVSMQGVTSSDFFNLLKRAVIEGVYADPLYGGNRDMGGWKMKEYPGNQMSYLDKIGAKEFLVIEPSSLHSHMPEQHKQQQ